MSSVLTPPKPETPVGAGGIGSDGSAFPGRGGGGPHGWSVPSRAYHTGMWVGLAGIVMLFAAFTSAMVVRKGFGNDWVQTRLPHILYLNTLVLLGSSAALEHARRALTQGESARFRHWLYLTAALGLTFLAGQLVGWRELATRGVYLATNPSSSFFYLLTATHGLHLLGGITALGYISGKARLISRGLKKRTAVDVAAIYWHFMDGLWVYILILFLVRL